MKYSLDKNVITLDEVYDLIIRLEYTGLELQSAKKRIRSRIDTAIKRGALGAVRGISLTKNTQIDAPEFFYWAVHEWPKLAKVEGLPIKKQIIEASAEVAASMTIDATPIVVSGNKEVLDEAYVRAESERAHLEIENQELSSALAKAESELRELKAKDAEIRRKKGRRGK